MEIQGIGSYTSYLRGLSYYSEVSSRERLASQTNSTDKSTLQAALEKLYGSSASEVDPFLPNLESLGSEYAPSLEKLSGSLKEIRTVEAEPSKVYEKAIKTYSEMSNTTVASTKTDLDV